MITGFVVGAVIAVAVVIVAAIFTWIFGHCRGSGANEAVKSLGCPLCGSNPETAEEPHKYVATRCANEIVVLCGSCHRTFVVKVSRPEPMV